MRSHPYLKFFREIIKQKIKKMQNNICENTGKQIKQEERNFFIQYSLIYIPRKCITSQKNSQNKNLTAFS